MAPERDLQFLQEAVKDLREYVLAKDLYWPLQNRARAAGGEQFPQLTIGNMALSQARLAACNLPVQQASEYAKLLDRIAQVRGEWQSNWQRKEEHEIESRIKLWQEYLRDLRGEPRQQAPFYPREVRSRVIIELLKPDIPGKTILIEQLNMLDQILRGLSQPGQFVWEAEISPGSRQSVSGFYMSRPLFADIW